MLRTTIMHFRSLRPAVRAMVYLHWAYGFVGALTSVFVQIFLYQKFQSISFNILGLIVYFIGCALGFSLVGALVARYRANMKWGYMAAFFMLCVSFLFLYGDITSARALWFMFMNGFGLGLYWVTLHTFELTETKNEERDYYSSVLSAGDQLIELVAPATAALLFYLSGDVLGWGTYTLLFLVAPMIYISGIPLFRDIRNYHPHPIERADTKHFLTDKKNRMAQVYLFAGSANFAFARVVLPIASIIFLGTEKNVGVFNAIFAVISACVLIVLSHHRHTKNRLRFLFYTSLASVIVTLLFAIRLDLVAFIIFTFLFVIIKPLQRVSAHVIDLETMETLSREGRDFFPTMIFRDAVFGVWRVIALLVLAFLLVSVTDIHLAIRIGLFALAGSTALMYYGAHLLYRK